MAVVLAGVIAGQAAITSPAIAAEYAWVPQSSDHNGLLRDVSFVDSSHGWAVGNTGTIVATRDGGATWTTQRRGDGKDLFGVSFVDSSHGWAVGAFGLILATSDGGETWTPQSGNGQKLVGVFFLDASHGWAVGARGTILATSDGGETWTPQTSGMGDEAIRDVWFADPSHGWAVAGWGDILATSDGGNSWTLQHSEPDAFLVDVTFTDALHGWAVDRSHKSKILATSDGGQTWITQFSSSIEADIGLEGVAFSDASHGWAVAEGGKILRTSDAGQNWNIDPSGSRGDSLQAVSFPGDDPDVGYAVGGEILKRTIAPPPPTVTAVEPDRGSSVEETSVTIRGTGFAHAYQVRFGERAVARRPRGAFTIESDTEITVVAPRDQPEGPVDVIVVGPGGGSEPTPASRFTYVDPTGGQWSPTGSMVSARMGHTATQLENGKVLVVGGHGLGPRLGSAELFDPATGTWSEAGSLRTPRDDHTATLLADGRVLVAGGCCDETQHGGQRDSAELYDPSTNSWSDAGSLNRRRSDHTATLLPDGKVLVAGGFPITAAEQEQSKNSTSAELYDPATNSWTETASFSDPRAYHTATLLTGPRCGANCGKVLLLGGWRGHAFQHLPDGSSDPWADPELYDPITGRWAPAAEQPFAREGHTATLLPNGEVLVAGGWAFGAPESCSAESYDPSTDTWSEVGVLSICRTNHGASLLSDGRTLVTGGERATTGGVTRSSEVFDSSPPAGTHYWTLVAPMKSTRTGGSSHAGPRLPTVALDRGPCGSNCGKVLAIGGDSDSGPVASAELYTPAPPSVFMPPASGSPPPASGPSPPASPLRSGRCANEQRGTRARDRLVGTISGDRLLGLAGNDILKGLAGRDCLSGGSGSDRLSGGSGNDRLSGGSGKDRLSGGSGNDRLSGGRGRNIHSAGRGNDSIFARNHVRETVNCGPGRDRAIVDRKDRVRGCERVRRR